MAWYESRACALCGAVIGKRWFWQEKPRLVAAGGEVLDAGYVDDARAPAVLATHVFACTSCYFNRFGELTALAGRQGGGSHAE